jgi:hypothetical protein
MDKRLGTFFAGLLVLITPVQYLLRRYISCSVGIITLSSIIYVEISTCNSCPERAIREEQTGKLLMSMSF